MRTWISPSSRCLAAAAAALLTACGSPSGGGAGGSPGGGGPSPSTGAGSNNPPPGPAGAACSVTSRGLPVSADKGTDPAIVAGAERYAVAWTSLAKDSGDIVFALLDPKGNKVKETPVDVGPGVAAHPSVTRLGQGYLVLWQVAAGSGSTVRGLRLGDDGSPAGSVFTLGSSQSKDARPESATRGGDVVVTYQDGAGSTVGLLQGSALIATQGIAKAADPAIAAASEHLGLVFLSEARLGFARLSLPLGPVTPTLFRDAPGTANLPRIAARADGGFDVVWEDDRAGMGAETVYITRFGADGKSSGELVVPPADGSANTPDVAALGSRSAVVYYQFRDGPPLVYLAIVAPDFTRENQDLQVSGKGARYPRIASSGDALGVIYADKDGPVRLSLVTCP